MAYADQQMSGNKITAIIIVAVIHVVVGYALVTGLAFSAAKKIAQKMQVIDIKEEVKKEEPPPPPPKKMDVPPPPTRIEVPPRQIDIPVPTAPTFAPEPPPPPPPPQILPPPPAPPPPPSKARVARPKNQGSWAGRIQENYPESARRAEKQGRVGVRVTIGPDGRVTGCTVTSSSGSSDLDNAACAGMERYARYDPALDDAGNPVSGTANTAIVYRLN